MTPRVNRTREESNDLVFEGAVQRVIDGRHNTAKLTPDDVLAIRELFLDGLTNREIASRYGVSWRAIEAIRYGQNWAWL